MHARIRVHAGGSAADTSSLAIPALHSGPVCLRAVSAERTLMSATQAVFRPLRYYRWALTQVRRLPKQEHEYYRQ